MLFKKKKFIQRNREVAHQRLVQDYFKEHVTFQGYYFRRWFCTHKHTFHRIVNDIATTCTYFQQCVEAKGTVGFTPIQKYTFALRHLAYVVELWCLSS